jgi:hypothetical protein
MRLLISAYAATKVQVERHSQIVDSIEASVRTDADISALSEKTEGRRNSL